MLPVRKPFQTFICPHCPSLYFFSSPKAFLRWGPKPRRMFQSWVNQGDAQSCTGKLWSSTPFLINSYCNICLFGQVLSIELMFSWHWLSWSRTLLLSGNGQLRPQHFTCEIKTPFPHMHHFTFTYTEFHLYASLTRGYCKPSHSALIFYWPG